jgi:adenylate kinase family enzyme
MAVKIFILGLPGSGKSGVARYIPMYMKDKGWKATQFNDYAILKKMFHDDIECKQFQPACHGGFDVLDFTVIDIALQRLEQEVNQYLSSTKQEEIILVEFARNDYLRAFQQFSATFLQGAYFLYLDAEIEICKQRIRNRVNNPIFDDDYYISEYIFETYYRKDNGRGLPDFLERGYHIGERVSIIDNNGSLKTASKKIAPIIDTAIESKPALADALDHPEKMFVGVQQVEISVWPMNNMFIFANLSEYHSCDF